MSKTPKVDNSFADLVARLNAMSNMTPDQERASLMEAARQEPRILDQKEVTLADIAKLAGIGSLNQAMDNSVPVIQAMKNAEKMAIERGDTDLAQQILQDIKGAQVRLSSGKDLNQIKYLQDKYSKFMPTEGIAYESKLAILLNQRLK